MVNPRTTLNKKSLNFGRLSIVRQRGLVIGFWDEWFSESGTTINRNFFLIFLI